MDSQTGGLPPSSVYFGYALLALAALCWGLTGSFARYFFSLGLTVSEFSFLRCATGVFCFGLHAVCSGEWRIDPGDFPKLLLFGMVCLGLLNLCNQTAVYESGAALAVILLYTAPAWVALLSRVFFGHRLGPRSLAAIGIAMSGAFLVALAGSEGSRLSWLGITAGLAAGLLYAMHFPWNYLWRGIYSPIALYSYGMLGGALLLLPLTEFTAQPALVWLQLFPALALVTYLPYLCYGLAMRRVRPTSAAVIVNLEPVAGCVTAFLWWNEQFAPLAWLGAGLVIAAVFVLALGTKDA